MLNKIIFPTCEKKKRYNCRHMANNQMKILERVIDNAFDFLEKAITEFDAEPKLSIMHFSAAIELFLKSRLIHEHWSLIVKDKIPDKKKFETGDFYSITIKESIEKIRKVLGDDFPNKYKTAFEKIAQHRNKLVHFFHPEIKEKMLQIKQDIAIEECLGWYYLRLLISKWDGPFARYKKKVEELNAKMKKHRIFLKSVYEEIKPDIELAQKNGSIFKTCASCQFNASEKSTIASNVFLFKCRVCLLDEELISIPCSKCEGLIEINAGDSELIKCDFCNYSISSTYIAEELNTKIIRSKDDADEGPINCAYCSTSDSVVAHDKLFICSRCRSITRDAPRCEWCNERQIGGVLEDSFLYGCDFCPGRMGDLNDD